MLKVFVSKAKCHVTKALAQMGGGELDTRRLPSHLESNKFKVEPLTVSYIWQTVLAKFPPRQFPPDSSPQDNYPTRTVPPRVAPLGIFFS